ncbi:Magnesium transporter MRS2-A, chloroplastic [Sesamum angolense]|uniref:Magnesium transporter n=1 Tax=Sesamum angolense TaxID=2727404 RepID=A0AAE1XBR8_9LAMI|nr:Magnesium transporter MRS2-A, chloroplastic [Sesamum angolense]
MASSTPISSQCSPNLLQLPLHSPQFRLILAGISLSRGKCDFSRKLLLLQQQKGWDPLRPVTAKEVGIKCFAEPAEETRSVEGIVLDKDGHDGASDDVTVEEVIGQEFSNGSAISQRIPASGDSLSLEFASLSMRRKLPDASWLGLTVVQAGHVFGVALNIYTDKILERRLVVEVRSNGLRPRDVRSVDPSLWLTNSMPSLLVREYAILLNLGSLRAIAMQERVYIFNYNRYLSSIYFKVVEAALHSRIQRLEHRLMDLEPRVQALLEVLPNRLTADILEELRISKQTLVELGSRAGALKQMLLDILEDTHEIRRICIMGRNCTLMKNDEVECSVPLEKEIAEEEEEEIEMLLENYLQRVSIVNSHSFPIEVTVWAFIDDPVSIYVAYVNLVMVKQRGFLIQQRREDSIAVNLSSRRLEVSRVELLLQVGTFCVGVGALIAGIFGMNLRSYLEENLFAFWVTTAGIFVGAVLGFFLMYSSHSSLLVSQDQSPLVCLPDCFPLPEVRGRPLTLSIHDTVKLNVNWNRTSLNCIHVSLEAFIVITV